MNPDAVPTAFPTPVCVNPGSAPSGTDYGWVTASNAYQSCQQAGYAVTAVQSVDGSAGESRRAGLGSEALLVLVVVAVMGVLIVNWAVALWRGTR